VGYVLAKAARSLKPQNLAEIFHAFHELEAFARKGGLSLDTVVVLLWLKKAQRSTVGSLSSSLNLSPSKTTRCLKELTASGLVDQSLDSEDYRKCYCRVSGKGVNVANEFVGAFGKEFLDKQTECFASLKRAARAAEMASGCKITSTAQRLLLSLFASKCPMTIGALCSAVLLSQPRASLSLKALKDNGFVEEEPQGSDHRTRSIVLSESGIELVAVMLPELKYTR
jgi:DNA-binding MarR family transcriptional regulator